MERGLAFEGFRGSWGVDRDVELGELHPVGSEWWGWWSVSSDALLNEFNFGAGDGRCSAHLLLDEHRRGRVGVRQLAMVVEGKVL